MACMSSGHTVQAVIAAWGERLALVKTIAEKAGLFEIIPLGAFTYLKVV